MDEQRPVITIDGPSGTGKGTICAMLADYLGWHRLDSGALYRLLALHLHVAKIPMEDQAAVVKAAHDLNIRFGPHAGIWLNDKEVGHAIRAEAIGQFASQLGALSYVREALLKRQRDFLQKPGLVTDGRDMGTVVFPNAQLKFFLTASAEERANRRFLQLKAEGICVTFAQVVGELAIRDDRDRTRAISPLVPAEDAIAIDTSTHSVVDVFNTVMHHVRQVMKL